MLRRPLLCIAFLAAAACGRTTSVWVYAVGSAGPLPSFGEGKCETANASNAAFEISEGSFRSRAPGSVTLHCESGNVKLVARPVAALTFDGEATRLEVGSKIYISVTAKDRSGHELTLTDDVAVEWSLGPDLREVGRCDHMLGTCVGDDTVAIIADAPGSTWVRAQYQGKQATLQLTVER